MLLRKRPVCSIAHAGFLFISIKSKWQDAIAMEEIIFENEVGVSDDFEADVIYRRDKREKLVRIKIPDDVEEVEIDGIDN